MTTNNAAAAAVAGKPGGACAGEPADPVRNLAKSYRSAGRGVVNGAGAVNFNRGRRRVRLAWSAIRFAASPRC